ncbi:IS21-like element helper ATPase IstB [Chitinibacteraceae bacterium HSL-7]
MLNPLTTEKLEQLSLHGMLRALQTQQQQPDATRLSFEERFGMLVDAELSHRDTRRIERLLKAAKLRHGSAALEAVDYRPGRNLDQALLMSLASCNWIAQRQSLILNGATGVGKSWLACALGKQACRNGYTTTYITATQLFDDLRAALATGTIGKLKRALSRVELLIIDDLGIGGIDVNLGPCLLEIIDLQSAVGGLLITSQYPSEQWYDLFNDTTVADAVLDRIVHRAHRIQLEGESLRKQIAK